ncbi:MAG: hypothetical protein EA397_12395 [Deltaproteobacteria bacterium]|nr:MAG: hypothetical protein EA397_12395 [Deltaproteobacteria bacterium]
MPPRQFVIPTLATLTLCHAACRPVPLEDDPPLPASSDSSSETSSETSTEGEPPLLVGDWTATMERYTDSEGDKLVPLPKSGTYTNEGHEFYYLFTYTLGATGDGQMWVRYDYLVENTTLEESVEDDYVLYQGSWSQSGDRSFDILLSDSNFDDLTDLTCTLPAGNDDELLCTFDTTPSEELSSLEVDFVRDP